MTDSADIKLVPLATATIAAGDRFKIDDGPFGNRVIAGIRTGRWEGDRLRGTIVGPGADWAMPGPGGAMLLDVRQVVQTDDGAVIYVTYHGRADRTRGTIQPVCASGSPASRANRGTVAAPCCTVSRNMERGRTHRPCAPYKAWYNTMTSRVSLWRTRPSTR